MKPADWFAYQFKATTEGLLWAFEQMPVERHDVEPPFPPEYLGEWSAHHHVFHLAFYERNLAIPAMRCRLGGILPERNDEQEAWEQRGSIAETLTAFERGRAEQMELIAQLSEVDWHQPYENFWGEAPLHWVVSKTYQHTLQHTQDILAMALFWDAFSEQLSADTPPLDYINRCNLI